MNAHPVANIFPGMSDTEYLALKADIAEHGQRESIWIWRGLVIDGRHRERACHELAIACKSREYDGDESSLVPFVVSLNLKRRHLDESQRAMVAAAIATLDRGANQHAQVCAPTQSAASELLNVSRRSVQAAKQVRDGHASEAIGEIERWMIVDLHAYRAHMIRSLRKAGNPTRKSNGDGTYFVAFDVREFGAKPPIMVASNFNFVPMPADA